MLIRKIRIENFRGFKDKTLHFDDKPLVLISAANGIGKTTAVDAIEWCLTGEIGRLLRAYNVRSSTQLDRKKNTDGILKNRYSSEQEKIKVTLWLLQDDKEICLCREQANDEINKNSSIVSIINSNENAEEFLSKYVDKNFYNFHFCDVQKSFEIQSKKRKDLKEFFEEFITDYDKEKQIVENLNLFVSDVDVCIKEKNNEIEKIDYAIEKYKEQLKEKKESRKEIDYPSTPLYSGEKIDISNFDKNELITQKNELRNCGYIFSNNIISRLIKDNDFANQQEILAQIISLYETKNLNIKEAIKFELFSSDNCLEEIKNEIKKLSDLTIDRSTYEEVALFFTIQNYKEFDQDDFQIKLSEIQAKDKKLSDLRNEIELLTKNNQILRLFSSLSVYKPDIIEYRNNIINNNGVAKCPICGSESFSVIPEIEILKEANSYIKMNGELAKVKEEETNILNKQKEQLVLTIVENEKHIVREIIEEKSKARNKIENIKNETQQFFNLFKKLQAIRKDLVIDNFDLEKAKELLNSISKNRIPIDERNTLIKSYRQILNVNGYGAEGETLFQTFEKTKALIMKSLEITNFSCDLFVAKINAIDFSLANKEIEEVERKMTQENILKQNVTNEIRKFSELKKKASKRAKEINLLLLKLSKDEYENVGPALEKYYNKLIRFNSNNGIKIVPDKDGLSLLDEKDKNVVNVLSNGQISVFMLAYFFAGINARHSQEKMKVYFIDDLTSCMDDVNMLAFLDILKYQMSNSNDKSIDQLFFVTCDDRISSLLQYKMKGRNIEIAKLEEKDISESLLLG